MAPPVRAIGSIRLRSGVVIGEVSEDLGFLAPAKGGRGGREAAGEGAFVGRSPPLRLGFAEPPLPHSVGARNPSWNEAPVPPTPER